jgi:hypothetical protein
MCDTRWVGQAVNFMLYKSGSAVAMNYGTNLARDRWTDHLNGYPLNSSRCWQAQSVIAIKLDICIFILPLPGL